MKHSSFLTFILLSAFSLLAVSGCKKAVLPQGSGDTKLKIQLSLSVNEPQVKAVDNAFEEGDQIGLYVSYDGELKAQGNYSDNRKYTLKSGVWTSESDLFWKDQESAADFYCYYPYAAPGNPLEYAFSVSANQSDLHSYKAADLLWGKCAGAVPSGGQVKITTSHLMSNLLVYLKPGKGFTEDEFAAANKKLAAEKNVRLIDGKEFAALLLEVGIKGLSL